MFPYRMVIEWSVEDESYVGRVPALPGCLGFGSTVAEAAAETQTGAEGILQAMKAHGRPLPTSDAAADYSGKLNLRLPRELHRQLAQLADLEDVSLNQLMVQLLAQRQAVKVTGRAAPAPAARAPRRRAKVG